MMCNLNYIVNLINVLLSILDWLDSLENHDDQFDLIMRSNFIHIIIMIASVLKMYMSLQYDSVEEMDAHKLIELLFGYRYGLKHLI